MRHLPRLVTASFVRRVTPFVLSLALLAAASPAMAQATAEDPGTTYTLFIHEGAAELALRADQSPRGAGYWARYADFAQELQRAGVLRGGSALHPRTSMRTVMSSGEVRAAAYSTAPAALGGYFVIEVASLDSAVAWAQRARTLGAAAVEVRTSYPSPAMR